jgi:hypothetical protein
MSTLCTPDRLMQQSRYLRSHTYPAQARHGGCEAFNAPRGHLTPATVAGHHPPSMSQTALQVPSTQVYCVTISGTPGRYSRVPAHYRPSADVEAALGWARSTPTGT